MVPFPHRYAATVTGTLDGDVTLTAEGLPALPSASPAEFGGPGDRWSPETLLVGAVADCFILTFRAIARASNLAWTSMACDAEGTLDRVARVTQFTAFRLKVRLHVPEGTDTALAGRLLQKAEEACLITNSLKASCHLEVDVQTDTHVTAGVV
jgi:peroxiredoxin-like protein